MNLELESKFQISEIFFKTHFFIITQEYALILERNKNTCENYPLEGRGWQPETLKLCHFKVGIVISVLIDILSEFNKTKRTSVGREGMTKKLWHFESGILFKVLRVILNDLDKTYRTNYPRTILFGLEMSYY